MKKALSILFLFFAVTISAQIQTPTRFGAGLRLTNATEVTDFNTFEGIPLLRKSDGLINNWIHSDSLVLQSQLGSLSLNLQQVTDAGNTTTNSINANNLSAVLGSTYQTFLNGANVQITDFSNNSNYTFTTSGLLAAKGTDILEIKYPKDDIFDSGEGTKELWFPYKNDTLAVLGDIKIDFADKNGNVQYSSSIDKRTGYYDTTNEVYYPGIQENIGSNGFRSYSIIPKDAKNIYPSSSSGTDAVVYVSCPVDRALSYSFDLNYHQPNTSNFFKAKVVMQTNGSFGIQQKDITILNSNENSNYVFYFEMFNGLPSIGVKNLDLPNQVVQNVMSIDNLVVHNRVGGSFDPSTLYEGWVFGAAPVSSFSTSPSNIFQGDNILPKSKPNGVQSVVAGTNITVDNTDPLNPIINSTGGGSTPTGLELIGTGWRLIGRDPNNYGTIGSNAVDFSTNTSASTTRGATGQFSFASGLGVTASGDYSFAHGASSNATGFRAVSFGGNASGSLSFSHGSANANGNTAVSFSGSSSGDLSFSTQGAVARAYREVSIGGFQVDNTPLSATAWNPLDRLFTVGNGENGLNRSNALVILKNGTITAPSLTTSLINTAGNKALVTKEYVDSSVPINANFYDEGTYFPTMGAGYTHAQGFGHWVRIGNQVTLNISIGNINGNSATGISISRPPSLPHATNTGTRTATIYRFINSNLTDTQLSKLKIFSASNFSEIEAAYIDVNAVQGNISFTAGGIIATITYVTNVYTP